VTYVISLFLILIPMESWPIRSYTRLVSIPRSTTNLIPVRDLWTSGGILRPWTFQFLCKGRGNWYDKELLDVSVVLLTSNRLLYEDVRHRSPAFQAAMLHNMTPHPLSCCHRLSGCERPLPFRSYDANVNGR
jgi:hypothetical protein